ncbi:MAG: hypothetical protein CML66_20435 [Rhodobacteraceae bacterium]|nr:hypothetical protein [Paracoccaceae bacterium]MAY44439.1 hypothetical protein [Paracoccaceae bacterium]
MTVQRLRDVLVPQVLYGGAADLPREDGCLRGDLLVRDGVVVDMVAGDGHAPRVVMPALVEAHCHLDKCHTIYRMEGIGGDLREAIAAQVEDKVLWTEDDLRTRVRQGMDEVAAAGCRLVRTHVDWLEGIAPPPAWSVIAEEAAARDGLRDGLAVDRSALVGIDVLAEPGAADAIAQVIARTGGTLGAFVLDHAGRGQGLRAVFAAADKYGLSLDFHVDEGLADDLDGLGMIADLVIETGFQGPVLCGHCCSLMNVSGDALDNLLERIAKAGICVTALPTTNLYLQGRGPGTPDRRGLTRLRELDAAGVPIAIASDNVADAFCPTGAHDPMAALNLAVLTGHMDPPFARWLPTITTNAARALGRDPVLVKGARLDDLRISAAANLPALVSGRHGAPAPITAGDLAPA